MGEREWVEGEGVRGMADEGAGRGRKIVLRKFSTLKIPLLSSTRNSVRLKVSDSEASWIGSLMPLAALVGGLLGGLALHRLGRKVRLGNHKALYCPR